jgi:hypothetical protein
MDVRHGSCYHFRGNLVRDAAIAALARVLLTFSEAHSFALVPAKLPYRGLQRLKEKTIQTQTPHGNKRITSVHDLSSQS